MIPDKISEWLVGFICDHPTFVGVAAGVWLLSTLTVNGLRMAWPKYDEQPRAVRFLIGFLDIGALNFWNIVRNLMPIRPNDAPLVAPKG